MFNKQAAFLVVDDLEAMRQVTASQLRTLGVSNIATANSGSEALRLLRKQKVDIVLSDWNMPGMTGLELLRTIRADASLSRLPFVMVTAEADRGRVAEAIASGVSGLLVKPYTAESLGARIEKALAPQPRPATPPQEQPLAVAPVPTSVAAPDAVAELTPQTLEEPFRATILVVDDAPANLHLLLNMFKDLYRVRVAQSGEKALEICQSDNPPDLVLLDIMMPGMDGFEVARRMREHPSSETIPVIFVTAMTGNDARLKGLELGAVDFVTKPIDPEVLKPRVRNFLRYVELHKQLQASYDGMFETARLREDVERITRHDIKGPLAGVIGLVQSMADDDTLNRKQQLEKLRMIEETALQVLNMINLSAELIKIETGSFKLDPQPVPIGDILRRIVKMSRASFAEKRITIVADLYEAEGRAVVQVQGDAMLCYSMFQNLIKNACEAAPENSRVTIAMADETPLRIVIQNKGAVPAEIRERFFDKFVTHNKQGGTGLGTYSAKLLAEAQAGAIVLKVSEPENLTTISVTLPRCS
ncbi:MAG: hybrid sensor histidine kinase/response regulator [Sterolibacterium sp.]